LGFTVFWFSPLAAAEPKDEVAAATAAWAQALGEDDPEKVLPLYVYAGDEGHLRGSVDPRVRQHGNQHTPSRMCSRTAKAKLSQLATVSPSLKTATIG
jgi:hypothetical protein